MKEAEADEKTRASLESANYTDRYAAASRYLAGRTTDKYVINNNNLSEETGAAGRPGASGPALLRSRRFAVVTTFTHSRTPVHRPIASR